MFFTGTKTDLAQLIKNLSISPQKTEIQELEKKNLFRISDPDPGVKKARDP